MTDPGGRDRSRVDRLLVRCRAPTRLEQLALDVRRRLDAVARHHLASALERVLAAENGAPGRGERRVYVEHVELGLDFDPRDYDDVTVAVLWAARIRKALEVLVDGAGPVRVFDDDAAWLRAALEELVASSRLSRVFEDLPCGSGWVLPLDFLTACESAERRRVVIDALLDDPGLARRLYGRLMPHERRAVVEVLEGRRTWGRWEARPPDDAHGRPAHPTEGLLARGRRWPSQEPAPPPGVRAVGGSRGSHAPRRHQRARGWWSGAGPPTLEEWQQALLDARAHPERFSGDVAPSTAHPPAAGRDASTLPASRAPRGQASGQPPDAGEDGSRSGTASSVGREGPPSSPTGVGGLVFAHPWLGAYLEAVVVGVDDPAGARRRALAVLADPAEPALTDDPLVRVLAGDDLAAPLRPAPPPREDAEEGAAAVLRAFATVLEGFQDSSPDFLRSQFFRRDGVVLSSDTRFVIARLEPAPADLVLDRLPYPVSPFRLPWTPEIRVEVIRHAR